MSAVYACHLDLLCLYLLQFTIWSWIIHQINTIQEIVRKIYPRLVVVSQASKSSHVLRVSTSYKENRNTQARIWIFSPSLDTAPLNSVWVVLLRFKSHTKWDNDRKDSKTLTCNFERRFRYRCVVDLLRSKFKKSLKLPKQRRQQLQRQRQKILISLVKWGK